MFSKRFLNTMIRNIKIHNIFDIIEISKSMDQYHYELWEKNDIYWWNFLDVESLGEFVINTSL